MAHALWTLGVLVLDLALCGGPLALVILIGSRLARMQPNRHLSYDDEEFWEADSPEESPPDFY